MIKLPPEITSVRIVLTPNPALAVQRPAIDAMPAGEIVYEDVPVQ